MMDSALLRQLCSDARKQTAETCPWPTCMKEALHKDMVAVRAKLRARLPYYQEVGFVMHILAICEDPPR